MSVYSDGGLENDRTEEENTGVGTVDLWLASAELFSQLGQAKDASNCIQEARNISVLSPDVFYQVSSLIIEEDMISLNILDYSLILLLYC